MMDFDTQHGGQVKRKRGRPAGAKLANASLDGKDFAESTSGAIALQPMPPTENNFIVNQNDVPI